MRRTGWGALWIAVYLVCIVLANWMIGHVGIAVPGGPHVLPVGFGLLAPSGTYAAALTLVARDLVQRTAGRSWGLVVIPIGVAITAIWDPRLALASGAAFACSETADFLVYSRLQWSLPLAVSLSASVGNVVDSTVFLALAGILLAPLWAGQVVGKAWAILLATAIILVVRAVQERWPATEAV